MGQASFGTATLADLREANKTLRFAKSNKDVSMKFPNLKKEGVTSWKETGMMALSDAAWATRPDGTSQGGYLVTLAPRSAFKDQIFPYAILDWKSHKLTRVSRSSLNAETQAAASAADALDFSKTFW